MAVWISRTKGAQQNAWQTLHKGEHNEAKLGRELSIEMPATKQSKVKSMILRRISLATLLLSASACSNLADRDRIAVERFNLADVESAQFDRVHWSESHSGCDTVGIGEVSASLHSYYDLWAEREWSREGRESLLAQWSSEFEARLSAHLANTTVELVDEPEAHCLAISVEILDLGFDALDGKSMVIERTDSSFSLPLSNVRLRAEFTDPDSGAVVALVLDKQAPTTPFRKTGSRMGSDRLARDNTLALIDRWAEGLAQLASQAASSDPRL